MNNLWLLYLKLSLFKSGQVPLLINWRTNILCNINRR